MKMEQHVIATDVYEEGQREKERDMLGKPKETRAGAFILLRKYMVAFL